MCYNNTVTRTIIKGGFMDAKADGEPNEPAIHGKNWNEFDANLKKISSLIDRNTKKEKVATEEFNLYKWYNYLSRNY